MGPVLRQKTLPIDGFHQTIDARNQSQVSMAFLSTLGKTTIATIATIAPSSRWYNIWVGSDFRKCINSARKKTQESISVFQAGESLAISACLMALLSSARILRPFSQLQFVCENGENIKVCILKCTDYDNTQCYV